MGRKAASQSPGESDGWQGGKSQTSRLDSPETGGQLARAATVPNLVLVTLGSLRDGGEGVSQHRHRHEKSSVSGDSPPCPARPRGLGRPLLGIPSLSSRCRPPKRHREWRGLSPRRRPDPQRPSWEDAPRAVRPRRSRARAAVPRGPRPPRRSPEPPAHPAGPASQPPLPSPAAAAARTRRRLRGRSSQPGFPSLTSFPVWA